MADASPRAPRVVIVGAGFAGLWAARGLSDAPVDLTLIDRHNFHTFYPLLYQVAAAELGPSDIAYPVRAILRRRGVRFHMTEVQTIDLDARRVRTADCEVGYDVLVLAMGSVPAFFGVEGAEEHAFPLRDMTHALPLSRQLLSRFETASFEPDAERRRALLTFVIVGGGPTGVEYAGALAELVHGPLSRDYPTISADEAQIILLEGGERVLSTMDEALGDYALARLRRRRVEVRLGTLVTRIRANGVDLADGSSIESHTVVWTAGIRGDPVVAGDLLHTIARHPAVQCATRPAPSHQHPRAQHLLRGLDVQTIRPSGAADRPISLDKGSSARVSKPNGVTHDPGPDRIHIGK